jgi:hypothetical protein
MAVLMTYSGSLRVQESIVPLLYYMHDTSYRSPSSEACMLNLNTDSDSLQETEFNEPNFIDMQALSIFSNICMSILITYLDSPLKIEFDEYGIMDMRRVFIFSNMTCNVTRGSLVELTLGSSRV